MRRKRNELWIVVIPIDLAIETQVEPMIRWNVVSVGAVVSEGEQSARIEFCVLADCELRWLLGGGQLSHYQNRDRDDVIRHFHLSNFSSGNDLTYSLKRHNECQNPDSGRTVSS